MKYQKILNEPDLIKDQETGAILNFSESSYYKYIKEKNRIKENQNRLVYLETEVQSIKNLLSQMMEKLDEINRRS